MQKTIEPIPLYKKPIAWLAGAGVAIGVYLFTRTASAGSPAITTAYPKRFILTMQVSKYYKLHHLIPNSNIWGWHQPTIQEWLNIVRIAEVLDKFQDRFGKLRIASVARPPDLRNKKGMSIKEALKAQGDRPAKVSENEFWAAADVSLFGSPSWVTWLQAFNFLQKLPEVRRVLFYWKTENGKKVPRYFHISVVRPGKPKTGQIAHMYLDYKPITVEQLKT